MVTLGVALVFVAVFGLLVALVYVTIRLPPAFWGTLRDFWSLKTFALAIAVAVALVLAVRVVLRLG